VQTALKQHMEAKFAAQHQELLSKLAALEGGGK
jgi:hypothetical protein